MLLLIVAHAAEDVVERLEPRPPSGGSVAPLSTLGHSTEPIKEVMVFALVILPRDLGHGHSAELVTAALEECVITGGRVGAGVGGGVRGGVRGG